jgi:glycosyltransferase involved in cell wall biosynthesis
LRVGLLYPGPDPLSSNFWSGTPRGLHDGLVSLGVEVIPIGARLPVGVHQIVAVLSRAGGKRGAVADRTVIRQLSRRWALSRSLAAAGELDAIVAMGTEMYDLAAIRPSSVPLATYDDATLVQMWRHADSDIRLSGFPENEVHQWFDRQATSSRSADVCCVSTEWAARSFLKDYAVKADHVEVIGIGHRPRCQVDPASRDWSKPRFLFIGVDWIRKNGDLVLRAFEELRRDKPDATLDVVGRHPQLDAPGVTGHGFLPRDDPRSQAHLDELFARATVFVLPSRFEPAGIAYLEAASAGLAVIATTQGGAAELLGTAAINVDPEDQASLLEAMRRLSEAGVARSMGTDAFHRAAESSWGHVAVRLLEALRRRFPERPW